MFSINKEVEEVYYLNKNIIVKDYVKGYRSGTDTILLASLVKAQEKQLILDVGCGIGVAALCLGYRIKNTTVYGIENNENLYNLAVENTKLNLNCNFIPVLGDILTYTNFFANFDHIMCNPPYYSKDDNATSLAKKFANIEGTAKLKDFINFSLKYLKDNGNFYMVNRTERLGETLAILEEKNISDIAIYPIHSYINKSATRFLLTAKKGSKAGMKLHFGIILHNNDGSYTKEAKEILVEGKSFYNIQGEL